MKMQFIFCLLLGFTTFIANAQNDNEINEEEDQSKLVRLIEYIVDHAEERDQARPVILFSKSQFRGKSFDLDDDWSANHDKNHWDDRIGSILVPRGWEVWVYEHANFQGKFLVINDDWSIRDNPWWEDRISSIRLFYSDNRRNPPQTERNRHNHRNHHEHGHRNRHHQELGITVYEHKQFSGSAKRLYNDWSTWDSDDFWNDRISAIDVPSGYTAVLYKHDDFRGRSLKLKGPCQIKLDEDWNDEVSSIQVRRR